MNIFQQTVAELKKRTAELETMHRDERERAENVKKRNYFEKYGEEPTILEAQGYDVANIFITLLARDDVRSRDDLRLAISQLANYPGVTGATTFNLVGDAEKTLYILQIQNGNIVQINSPDSLSEDLTGEETDVPLPAE